MSHSWDEFELKRDAAPPNEERTRFDQLCATVFMSGAGAELFKAMRARTVERRSQPGANEAVLREDEAVRRFVAGLDLAAQRGLAAAAKSKSET